MWLLISRFIFKNHLWTFFLPWLPSSSSDAPEVGAPVPGAGVGEEDVAPVAHLAPGAAGQRHQVAEPVGGAAGGEDAALGPEDGPQRGLFFLLAKLAFWHCLQKETRVATDKEKKGRNKNNKKKLFHNCNALVTSGHKLFIFKVERSEKIA